MILSIVIPVYNIEKYIVKCLESVLVLEAEIIIVNDGSTDSSLELVDSFLARNKNYNIKVITQVNSGLSEARNSGLRACTGKYVWFVDGDDYVDNNYIDSLIKLLNKTNFNVVTFGYNVVNFETEEILYIYDIDHLGDVSLENGLKKIPKPICNVWRYVVNRQFLIDNNIWFRKYVLCEDIEWTVRILAKSKRISLLNQNLYNYRVNRQSSIMSNVSIKRVNDVFNNISLSHREIKVSDLEFKVKLIFYKNLIIHYFYNIYTMNLMKEEDFKSIKKELGLFSIRKINIILFTKITLVLKKIRKRRL